MYETSADRLLAALTAAFGDGPRWELTPNRSHGYSLRYDPGEVTMRQIRTVIEDTLDFSVGVILAPRQ
ncbi:MAG TPA: hypothetical protein VGJ95_14795 [Pseudonocardiaceae bacterium]|jgi:hypothetical protein